MAARGRRGRDPAVRERVILAHLALADRLAARYRGRPNTTATTCGRPQFTVDEIVAASAGGTGNEPVELTSPPDDSYQVWIHGFAVSGSPTFPLTIDAVQGNDLQVSGLPSGPVPASTPVTLHVTFSKQMVSGQDYNGELRIGPTVAPNLATVPVKIHRQ